MKAKLLTGAVIALAFFGLGLYVGLNYVTDNLPPPPPLEVPESTKKIITLREQNQRLQEEITRLSARVATLSTPRPAAPPVAAAPVAVVQPAAPEMSLPAKQRAILNNLRQITAAADQFKLENGRSPTLDELVGETKYIRRLNPVDGESYAGLSLLPGQAMTVVSPNGVAVTYDPAGSTTTQIPRPSTAEQIAQSAVNFGPKVGPAFQRAATAYLAANGGATPPTPESLLPYFSNPQEGADFVEFIEAQKSGRKK